MEHQLRLSLDHLLEGVQIVDRQWRYVYVNETAAAHGQRPAGELMGRTMMECFPGIEQTEMFIALRRVMETRASETLRNEFAYPSGERRWFDLVIDPVPDGLCILSLDVTDRRRAELELHHSQRMEAIGKLAGGVAHDFNNQLTAIRGFAEILLGVVTEERIRRDLQAILEAAERSSTLTRQLLAFGRRQVFSIEPTDLNTVVASVDRLLRRLIGEHVRCVLRLSSDPAVIMADTRQLENVLTNLAVNARDAMPGGGRLTMATSIVELSSDDARQHPMMAPGRYAVLAVSDTGHGMDDATKARIFEPFFTTKTQGQGTGLGLSSVYGIVKQMGGFIWVYSEVGRGTTFRLYFPTTSAAPRARTERERHDQTRRRARGTILVIEDDTGVRDLITRALSEAGHVVVAAASGEEASRLVGELPARPELALTDVVLPGERGPSVVRRLGFTDERVIYMSGYSERTPEESAAEILEKPFTIRTLLERIDERLPGDRELDSSGSVATPAPGGSRGPGAGVGGGEADAAARRTRGPSGASRRPRAGLRRTPRSSSG